MLVYFSLLKYCLVFIVINMVWINRIINQIITRLFRAKHVFLEYVISNEIIRVFIIQGEY